MAPRRARALKERRLSRLNWMEMGTLVPRRIHTLLLPVGTLEAHAITSLGTDNEIPARLSEAVAERLNALVAPTIPYGVTAHLGALAGGTHVPAGPFTEYVASVLTTLSHQGFSNIILMNGHGGNTDALREAARDVHERTGTYVAVFSWWTETRAIGEETLGAPGGHAGSDETAAMLAIAPEQVFPERWDPSLAFEHRDSLAAYPVPGSLIFYGGRRSDPVFHTKRALAFWERVVQHVGDVLEDLVRRWDREGWPAPRAGRVRRSGRDGVPARPGLAAVPPPTPPRRPQK
jgi:creatinine amidohydrolase